MESHAALSNVFGHLRPGGARRRGRRQAAGPVQP
jgi:hypothetical protein